MTEKELRRLSKLDILELLLDKQREVDRLTAELEETKAQLNDRRLKLGRVGSLAEASLAVTKVFEEAQRSADIYLRNVKKLAESYEKKE